MSAIGTAFEEIRSGLIQADCSTLNELLEYLEVVDREGFLRVVTLLTETFRNRVQAGRDPLREVAFCAEFALVVGAGLAKRGLL